MAKVIQTPTIARHARRALPVVHTEPVAPETSEIGSAKVTDSGAVASRPSAELRAIMQANAERDAALQRAELAESNLDELQSQLTELREAAQEQGFQAGLKQADEAGAAQQASDASRLNDLLDNLTKQQHQLIQQAEEAAVEIGIAATIKLLGRANTDTKMLESLVRQSLQQVLSREGIVIHLGPADCERMHAIARQQEQDWVGVEFKPDVRIKQGGCRIESRAGSLDARLEVQLKELTRVVEGSRAQRQQDKGSA